MARELELRSALEEKGKKRGMTSGSHDLPDKYLGITSGGPSAGPVRTVREAVVTILPPKRNLAPRFKEWLKGEL